MKSEKSLKALKANRFGAPGYLRTTSRIAAAGALLICVLAAQPQGQGQNQGQGQGAGAGQAQGRGGRGRGITADPDHPVLAIGSPAPDFDLPGIDGKNHTLAEYSNAKLLAIVFESNHCPASIGYEGRIKQLYEDYKSKGMQLVAINPNNAGAVRLNELGYTDMTDSLPEMKVRAGYRHIEWPYLYDGETQSVAIKFGASATPHLFIFDQDRKLRYEGHIDDSLRESNVKAQDARNAIEALLAGQPVPVASTRAFGCSTKWLSKAGDVQAEWTKIQAEPVKVDAAGAGDLKKLRANASTGKVVVVSFWSTKCKDCIDDFKAMETTNWMYRGRDFALVTVSTDRPSDSAAVLKILQDQHAGNRNLQFATADAKSLQAAFGAKWKLNEPFTMVIGPDGKVIYQKAGKQDVLLTRRYVLANLSDKGDGFAGVQAYWTSVINGGQ